MAQRFEAVIEVEGRTATYFEVPLDVPAVFGRARPPVRVMIGGHTRTGARLRRTATATSCR